MRLNQFIYVSFIHGSEPVGPIHVFKDYVVLTTHFWTFSYSLESHAKTKVIFWAKIQANIFLFHWVPGDGGDAEGVGGDEGVAGVDEQVADDALVAAEELGHSDVAFGFGIGENWPEGFS